MILYSLAQTLTYNLKVNLISAPALAVTLTWSPEVTSCFIRTELERGVAGMVLKKKLNKPIRNYLQWQIPTALVYIVNEFNAGGMICTLLCVCMFL